MTKLRQKLQISLFDVIRALRCVHIQLFRERLSQKLCTRQSRKVIWDMINTLVVDTVAVEPTFVAFLQPSQTYVHGLSFYSLKFL